jgi:hypothetical protein
MENLLNRPDLSEGIAGKLGCGCEPEPEDGNGGTVKKDMVLGEREATVADIR